jgi:hypothetical protein
VSSSQQPDSSIFDLIMTEAEAITEPDLLDEFCITAGLSTLSTGTSGVSPESAPLTKKARLVLLQPLANPDILQACRNPHVRAPRSSRRLHEFLDIRPLSKAWRHATIKVPPFSHLIFDLTLPKQHERHNDPFHKVYWDVAMPRGDGLGVHVQDVMNLVIIIATETRIRAKGNVCFELVYDETDRVARGAVACLNRQLLALQQFPGKKDAERANAEWANAGMVNADTSLQGTLRALRHML